MNIAGKIYSYIFKFYYPCTKNSIYWAILKKLDLLEISKVLKAHSQVQDNFWQLKTL